MIGGRDIIIPVSNGSNALHMAVCAVVRFWPSVVLEDGKSGEVLSSGDDISLKGRNEILAFRDEASAKLWDELGADPLLGGTLIHFLASDGELTVVIDSAPSDEIKLFVHDLRRELKQGVLTKQT